VKIEIYKDLCKECGICISFCPHKVLDRSEEINSRGFHPPKVVSEDRCTECKLCELLCPDFAIAIKSSKQYIVPS